MALDTTLGGATAESYITVAAADTYFLNRDNTAWTALTPAAKEAALRKATDYMDQTYGQAWAGIRVDSVQVLDFPRTGIMIDGYEATYTAIPAGVQRACAELAVKAAAGDLSADQTRGVLEKKVGPIETVYDPLSAQETQYKTVENILRPFTTGLASINFKLVQA